MKFFPIFTAAFLAKEHANRQHDATTYLMQSTATTRVDAERKECAVFSVRRRLLERSVNNQKCESLDPLDLHPGDAVKQKSDLLDPDTAEKIGFVYTQADVLDDDYRLAHGAYAITKGDRVGMINFSALIPNEQATKEFDMAITSGTGDFHGAQGWIVVGNLFENQGAQERDATFNICGLYT